MKTLLKLLGFKVKAKSRLSKAAKQRLILESQGRRLDGTFMRKVPINYLGKEIGSFYMN